MDSELAELRTSDSGFFTRRVFASVLALALSSTVLSISAATASASPKVVSCHTANGIKVTNAEVCKGLLFYKGKTVTFIAPTGAGTIYDILSRAFAPELSQYLGANVVDENISGANGIVGMDALAASTPNGLTIGYYSIAAVFGDIVTNAPSVAFNFRDIAVFMGEESGLPIVATLSTSPYTSFAVLKRDDTIANPVKIVTNVGNQATDVSLMMREFGLPYTLLTGYSGTPAALTGFIRGDGPVAGSSFPNMESYIEAGTVRMLALDIQSLKVSRKQPMATTLLAKIPTAGALDKIYPPKTNGEKAAAKYLPLANPSSYVPGGPSAMPSYLVTTMRAAYKWAEATPDIRNETISLGNLPVFLTPSAVKVSVLETTKLGSKIASFLGF